MDPTPGGYFAKFNAGRFGTEFQLLTLLYTVLTEKRPLMYASDPYSLRAGSP